jgi:hypothetical protein
VGAAGLFADDVESGAVGEPRGDHDFSAPAKLHCRGVVVVGGVTNNAGAQSLAQVGVLDITGDLVNNGIVVGNVITAPGFKGGGTGDGTDRP